MGLQSDGVLGFVLLDIAIILIVARLVGALARKVGQPTVVGEIVAGVLLGPTLLGRTVFAWDHPWSFLNCRQALAPLPLAMRAPSITACFFPPQSRSVLGILGQIALVLFMFLVGLELDFNLLKGKGASIVSVAVGVVALPLILAFAVGPVLYSSKFVPKFGTPMAPSRTSFTLMLGAMLTVTAFPVMARILQEKKLTQSPMGSIGVAAAAVVTVLMFLMVAVASGVASNQGPSSLAVKFIIAGIYIAILFLVVRPALVPLGRAYEAKGTLTPVVFATVIIVLFASAFVAHKIGINVIVGGFLAGAVMPARQSLFREMAGRLSDLTAIILLPIFLAFSGLATDFTKLGVSFLGGIAIFLIAGIVGKWLGGALGARIGGLSWAEGNVIGVLMNCRGLLVLVVALIAVNQNVISAPLQVGGVLMALITTAMTGPLFDVFLKKVPNAVPGLPGQGMPASQPPDTYRVLAVLGELDRGPVVARAAFSLMGDRLSGEVVFCHLFPLPPHEFLAGINEELVQVDRSMRALRILGSFRPENISVTPIASASNDIAGDIIRIAIDRQCDAIVIERQGTPTAILRQVVDHAPFDVVVCVNSDSDRTTQGPILVQGDSSGETAKLIGQLALGLGRPVEHRDVGDDHDRIGASALVLIGGPTTALAQDLDADARCSIYVVRPRSAALTADDSHRRS